MSLAYRLRMGVALGCAIGGGWLGYRAWTAPWLQTDVPNFDVLGVTWLFANLPLLLMRGMSVLLGMFAVGLVVSALIRRHLA